MAQQNIDIGSYPSDGTGDPLRDAFTKINQNFDELYSGNVQVTAANILVYSVAGRTGNINLTVNDVAQAASKSYVNNTIASNIATKASLTGATFTGNITANNISTSGLISSSKLYVGISDSDVAGFNIPSFVGDQSPFYGVAIQNKSESNLGLTGYIAFPNGPASYNNFAQFGITSRNYSDPLYPEFFPCDTYVFTHGGNLILDSETNNVRIQTSNITRLEVLNSGTVKINSNILFSDNTLQITAFTGNTSIGFTMTNPGDWTAPVYTIHDALNQLASRLKALEDL
jgi:hypothetical protein